MKILLFAALLCSFPVFAQDKPCDPAASHCDGRFFHFGPPGVLATSLHVAAMATVVLDLSQTLDIKNHPRYAESNPLLGRHPGDGRVVLYGVGVILLHTAVWYVAPEEVRPFLDLAVVYVEVPIIEGNIDYYGLRFRLPF